MLVVLLLVVLVFLVTVLVITVVVLHLEPVIQENNVVLALALYVQQAYGLRRLILHFS